MEGSTAFALSQGRDYSALREEGHAGTRVRQARRTVREEPKHQKLSGSVTLRAHRARSENQNPRRTRGASLRKRGKLCFLRPRRRMQLELALICPTLAFERSWLESTFVGTSLSGFRWQGSRPLEAQGSTPI